MGVLCSRLNPYLIGKGVDIGPIVSTPLPYLAAKTGMLNGKLLFRLYPEHLGATYRAHTLSRWFTVLHDYGLSIFHFPFGTTFDAVCLHWLATGRRLQL